MPKSLFPSNHPTKKNSPQRHRRKTFARIEMRRAAVPGKDVTPSAFPGSVESASTLGLTNVYRRKKWLGFRRSEDRYRYAGLRIQICRARKAVQMNDRLGRKKQD